VVSLGQLQLLGLGRAAVAKRTRAGRLHRLYRGVYAVGHARLTGQGRWMAAVLACGKRAALSHRSASTLTAILRTARAKPDVTLPCPCARARHGITVHSSVTLTEADITTVDGIPCTDGELEERFFALCRAAALPSPEVNVWLKIDDGNPIKADFLWRAEKLVVETDGRASHGTRQAFETDRLRDQRLKLARYEVVHFTWRQVVKEPTRVAAVVKRLLAR
jgi:very-short-patch-repair endonuclease